MPAFCKQTDRPDPDAKPPMSVIDLKATVPSGKTDFDWLVALMAGGVTVAVMVAKADCPTESVTTYLIAVAVPLKVLNGVKVTVPSELME